MPPSTKNDRIQEFAQLLCLGGLHIFCAATYFATAAPGGYLPTPPPSPPPSSPRSSLSSSSSPSSSSSFSDAGPNTTTTTTTPQIGGMLGSSLLTALAASRFWPMALSWYWLHAAVARGRWAPARSMPHLGGFLTAVMAWVLMLLQHLVSDGANGGKGANAPWSATAMVGCGLFCYWVGYALEWRSGYWFQFAEVMVRLSEKNEKKNEEEAYRLPTREVPVSRGENKVTVEKM